MAKTPVQVAAITSVTRDGISFQWFTGWRKLKHEASLDWDEIQVATVFKRDLFTYDLICLRLETAQGEGFEVDEKDPNWLRLIEGMEEHLLECVPWAQWFMEVAFPAFDPNPRVVFLREGAPSPS